MGRLAARGTTPELAIHPGSASCLVRRLHRRPSPRPRNADRRSRRCLRRGHLVRRPHREAARLLLRLAGDQCRRLRKCADCRPPYAVAGLCKRVRLQRHKPASRLGEIASSHSTASTFRIALDKLATCPAGPVQHAAGCACAAVESTFKEDQSAIAVTSPRQAVRGRVHVNRRFRDVLPLCHSG